MAPDEVWLAPGEFPAVASVATLPEPALDGELAEPPQTVRLARPLREWLFSAGMLTWGMDTMFFLLRIAIC